MTTFAVKTDISICLKETVKFVQKEMITIGFDIPESVRIIFTAKFTSYKCKPGEDLRSPEVPFHSNY